MDKTDREIANSDLWSAIRGLGMYGMSRDELVMLAERYEADPLFCGRVIAVAARQVLATKRTCGDAA